MKTVPVSISLQNSSGEPVELNGEVTDLQVITITTLWLNRIDETVNQEKGIQIMEELQKIKDKAEQEGIKEEQAFANQSLAFMHKLNCDMDCRKKTYAALSIIFGEEINDISFSIEEIGKIMSVLTAPMFKFFGEQEEETKTSEYKTLEEELAIAREEIKKLTKAGKVIDVVKT